MASTINYIITINPPSTTEDLPSVIISKEANNKNNIVSVEAKMYKLSLKSFHYHKKMYEPLEIKASVQVSRYNSNDGIDISDLSAIREKLLGSKISKVYADNNTIAENCFVYAASYIIKKGSETTPSFELTICSPDKKLDLDKFNEAYTGKQFFEEITKPLCLKVGMEVENLSFEPTFGQYSVADSKDNKPKEYRTPYLVQYDETPLTFLSRTANRNGEFLYFEGGKYNVGLKSTAEKDIKNYNDIPNFYSLSDKKMNVSGLKTGFHTYNYTKDNLNFTADNDDTIYYRSFELLNDEDFTSLKEQKDLFKDAADGAMYFVNNFFFAGSMKWKKDAEGNYAESFVPKKLVKIFSKVLNNSKSLSELGLKYLTENLTSYCFSLAGLDKDKSENNENVKGYKNIVADNTGKDDDLDCVYQFTNFPVSHATYKHKKIDVSFRQMILENEESLLDKVLQLEYKGHPDITLGKLLKIGTTKYIVIEIEPCVLQVTDEENIVSDVEGLRVLVIPYSVLSIKNGDANKDEPCPLPLPYEKGLVRKSEMQHAIVTQNDDPEGLGRVRVAYLWQHGKLKADELSNSENESDTKKLNATPWIRIVTPMANEEGGHYFKPDVGDEVMVDYEYGNVERPYVMGEVFSKNRKIGSDYNITSPNGHSITFNNPDSPTAEWVNSIFPAIGNLAKFIPQMQSAMGSWGGDRRVGGGIELSDALGFYNISMSTSGRSISISSPLGNIEMSAFTGISIEAPNGDISIKGKNIEIEAGNSITVTSGTNIKKNGKKRGGLIPLDKKGELDGVALLSSVTNTLLKPFVDLTKVVDLNLIRTIIEVFVRPVNGTLLLKSNRYLELEAGKGATEVPTVDYDSTSKYGKRVLTTSNKDKAKVTKIKDLFKFFALLANEAYDFINVNHNALLGEADDGNDYQKFCAEYTKYKLLIRTSNNFTAFKTKVYTLKTVEELIGTIYSKIEGKTDYDLTNENNKLKLADFAKDIKISDVNDLDSEEMKIYKSDYEIHLMQANKLLVVLYSMYQKALLIDQCTFKGLSTLTDPQKDLIDALGLDTLIFEKVKDLYPDIYKDLLNKQLPKTDALNDTYIVTDFCNNAGHIKKAFVIEFIEHCKAREINVDYVNPENPTDNHTDVKYYIPHKQKPTITLGNPFPDTEYKDYIEDITLKDPAPTAEKTFGQKFLKTVGDSFTKAYKDFKEPMEDLYAWDRKTNNGTILLSSSEGYTTELQKLASSSAAPFKTRHSEVGQYDEDLKSEIDVFKQLS